MTLLHRFEIVAGLALVALSLVATPASTAQTVINNETLVTTTFVVNKTSATARCKNTGCRAKTQMFAPIPVTCPAATGHTCTFHISLDAKVLVSFHCGSQGCFGSGPQGSYQFLVDDAAPTIGPTDGNGSYIFENGVFTSSDDLKGALKTRQSYPASVLAAVTNSGSNSHTIVVNVGCQDTKGTTLGCEATSHWSTMRVDVFEP
jgi:hypothetical protein